MFHISTHAPLAGRDPIIPHFCGDVKQFNSHVPCGARLFTDDVQALFAEFQLTRALRGATCRAVPAERSDFNSHAPCGARPTGTRVNTITRGFQLTRPLRGATPQPFLWYRNAFDFNSHAPCGARRYLKIWRFPYYRISTHTPLAGRDMDILGWVFQFL